MHRNVGVPPSDGLGLDHQIWTLYGHGSAATVPVKAPRRLSKDLV